MTQQYKEILKEIKETVTILEEEIENPHTSKFFIGKLHLLTNSLLGAFLEDN